MLAFWTTTSYVKDGESLLLHGHTRRIESTLASAMIRGLRVLVSGAVTSFQLSQKDADSAV